MDVDRKPLGVYAYVFKEKTDVQFPLNVYYSAYDKQTGEYLYGAFNSKDMSMYLMNNYSSVVYMSDNDRWVSSVGHK